MKNKLFILGHKEKEK